MGAAAVFEMAAETPPTAQCCQLDVPIVSIFSALIASYAELRPSPILALSA